ncbi:hypothetical protein D1AOALGA4SA_3177 [Olavius algarvensis Delta 1 endosymbiont]|nr:hypothetical protein D1AOALGA4SA_3177 [Olavius algarvensis Delta 1 endosymbiont]
MEELAAHFPDTRNLTPETKPFCKVTIYAGFTYLMQGR